jgi:hypothetical protein
MQLYLTSYTGEARQCTHEEVWSTTAGELRNFAHPRRTASKASKRLADRDA